MTRAIGLAAVSLFLVGCAGSPPPKAAPAPAAAIRAERPIPYPVVPPPAFQRAVERGTRTVTGAPGPRYWQNWTDYRLRTRIFPAEKRLEGSAELVYHNNSPDTLHQLHLDLNQNLHAPGAARNEEAQVTGGVNLKRVTVAGQLLTEAQGQGPRYGVIGTRLVLVPPRPVLPGERVNIGVDWAFNVPRAGAGARMGYDKDDLLFMAYWYPQMAVYDDVGGWHPDPFLGQAEFYSGFGSYDMTVEAPEGWVVMGTGALRNPAEVLTAPVVERLRVAERSDTVVRILTPADFPHATQRSRDGWLRWHFVADTVRDVAFGAMRRSYWDATRTAVGDRDGDGQTEYTRIDAFYREPAVRWRNVARYAQHAINFLSRYTGYPYPWPHMTSVEGAGIITGGMEYPMLTLMGDYTQAGDSALYNVTAHELAHMWIPMIVGTDERRFSWLDEGATTFNENQARMEFFPGVNHNLPDQLSYVRMALSGMEGEMMRRSDFHYSPQAFGVASYAKPASVLVALRGILGEETFDRAYREFIRQWAFKHPQPWDMWHTFESVSGRDLDWFWRSWYYETWTLDQAVAGVTTGPGGTVITVEDRGLVPMPVRLTITRADRQTEQREIPVEQWLTGAKTASVTVPGAVTRVEIDPEQVFPDVNRTNNVWTQ